MKDIVIFSKSLRPPKNCLASKMIPVVSYWYWPLRELWRLRARGVLVDVDIQ